MKMRTTVVVWTVLLVVIVLGASIATVAMLFDHSTRSRAAEDLARSRRMTLDQHAARQSVYRQRCQLFAEDPRVHAVAATEDVARETILDAMHTLAETQRAGVFLITDAGGKLVADHAARDAKGLDLRDRPVVAQALDKGEGSGVWLVDSEAVQVEGCRLEVGARVVGGLVVGHAIDDEVVDGIARQTGGLVVVVADHQALTHMPEGVTAGELGVAIDQVRGGAREVSLAGSPWYAQLVSMPGYTGEHRVGYLMLRSIDEALAPLRAMERALAGLAIAGVVAAMLLAFVLARQISRPIDALAARTTQIVHGDVEPRELRGPTEVKALGVAMDQLARELDESRRQLAEKERLARELEFAARIQASILPRNLAVDGLEIAARMITATEVGGDYYDVLPVDDGCWIAVGDASGHGLTAGLVMMMVQTGIATLVRGYPDAAPKSVLSTMNRVLFENVHDRLQAERHMTLSLLRLRRDGSCQVAGAHMDAVVWRAASQQTELLGTPGTFLAITDDIDHVNIEQTWQLHPGDLLVLLTDGITEAEDPAGKAFGYEGVLDVVEPRASKPVAQVRDALFEAVTKHSATLADDATIVVLRFVGSGATTS